MSFVQPLMLRAVVTYRALIGSDANILQLVNSANAAFTFQSVAGGLVITGVIPSNNSVLLVYSPNLSIVKSESTTNATVGDQVTYTLQVNNAVDAKVSDSLPAGMEFVDGSLGWNGVKRPGTNLVQGFNLGTLTARSVINIHFEAKLTHPENTGTDHFELVNQARLLYTFRLPDVLPAGAKWRGQAVEQFQWSIPEYSSPRYLHVGELEPGSERNISYVA
ncbi:hypothetical protein [Paenibacillus sp. QZ-Y1]|uniref:hypothetical protein n=1 Tax=Paenibacillus sp. QZ-Y1 TaxID=3414511 RepID=UPI003F79284F